MENIDKCSMVSKFYIFFHLTDNNTENRIYKNTICSHYIYRKHCNMKPVRFVFTNYKK